LDSLTELLKPVVLIITKNGHNIQHSNEVATNIVKITKLETTKIHNCLKCFDNKNVVVASSDIEIYSLVQGDIKTTNRLRQ
jgi:hypothetical protein